MAEKPGGKPAAAPKKSLHAEIGWFVWGLVGIGVLWFFMGGYARQESRQPYIKPAAPLDSGQTYGRVYVTNAAKEKQTLDLPEAPADIIRNLQSGLKEIFTRSKVATSENIYFDSMNSIAGAKESDIQKEYLEIDAGSSNKTAINISGLILRGSGFGITDYGISEEIPKVAKLPIMGVPYITDDLEVTAGGQVIVSSGKSPIGESFQVNICSGYLGQFQTFTPALRNDCPEPLVALESSSANAELSCRTFVATLPRCQAYGGSFPSDLSSDCKLFVTEKLNYNSCVSDHNRESNFYLPEWRVFLGRTSELWKNKGETIRLMNENGATIDALVY